MLLLCCKLNFLLHDKKNFMNNKHGGMFHDLEPGGLIEAMSFLCDVEYQKKI